MLPTLHNPIHILTITLLTLLPLLPPTTALQCLPLSPGAPLPHEEHCTSLLTLLRRHPAHAHLMQWGRHLSNTPRTMRLPKLLYVRTCGLKLDLKAQAAEDTVDTFSLWDVASAAEDVVDACLAGLGMVGVDGVVSVMGRVEVRLVRVRKGEAGLGVGRWNGSLGGGRGDGGGGVMYE